MGRVIPDYLSDGTDNSYYAGSAFSSVRMIMGEVQEIVQPTDPRNVNKRVAEYSVWCAMYENGTYASRLISNVVAMDMFGSGVADFLDFTYRGAKSANVADGNNQLGYGLGSKVLLMAINGNRNNYIIVGGIRNSKSNPISADLGHHLDFSFQGVTANVNNSGELTISYTGAQNIDGTLRSDVDQDAVGTTIQFQKNGSLIILDKDSKESILIDRPNGKIQIGASTEIDLNAPQVTINGSSEIDLNTDQLKLNATTETDIATAQLNITASTGVSIAAPGIALNASSISLGKAPTTAAVQGTQLVAILTQLCEQLAELTVICTAPGSPSSPPVNAPAIAALAGQLSSILSPTVRL